MTVNIIFSDATDGYLTSNNATYATALAGPAFTADTSATVGYYGQNHNSGYTVLEAFLKFVYTAPANEVVTSAAVRVKHGTILSTGVARDLEIRSFDWGATLTTADWRTTAQLAAASLLAKTTSVQAATTSKYCYAGSDELLALLASSATLNMVAVSSRQRAGTTPTSDEGANIWLADLSGTADDPALVYTSCPQSTLFRVMGAQVKNAGPASYMVLESNGASTPTVLLRSVDSAGTPTTIATIPIGTTASDFYAGPGAQALTLVYDGDSSVYVIGRAGNAENTIMAKAWTFPEGGPSWVAGTARSAALPTYDTSLNNFAAGFHSVGTGGTIVVLCGHTAGQGTAAGTNEIAYALLDAGYLKGTSGTTLLRGSGSATGLLMSATPASNDYTAFTNETGTGLDLAVNGTKGWFHSWKRSQTPGDNDTTCQGFYVINATGTAFTTTAFDESAHDAFGEKNAGGKVRALAVSLTEAAFASLDSDSGWGLSLESIVNTVGTTMTEFGYVPLDQESIATLPDAGTLTGSAAWDVLVSQTENKVWVYYFSSADGRRLMRTGYDLNSYLATKEEVQVSAAVGAVGSTNLAIRVSRNAAHTDKALISIANRSSGGVHSTVYVIDTFNLAPTAPTLTPKANFDATAATTFAWTFNDPNAGDTQSAFELDINTSGGADIYTTGKMGAAETVRTPGSTTVNVNASVTPTMPTGWAPGDLLLVLASIRNSGAGTVNVPAGWTQLAASGNAAVLGRIARTGDVAPTITFAGGVALADTMTKMVAISGTDQNIATVLHNSASQLNGSAQNVATPALTVTAPGCTVVWFGWKQDDLTSVTGPAGSVFSDSASSTGGDDASQQFAYVIQTTATNIAAGSFTVTGGAAAISRGIVLAFRPYQAPTTPSFTLPANLLTNGNAYQWLVKTYDAAGLASPWSSAGSFSTSAGGTVTITDPATDNVAGIITDDYTVQWSVSGTTQASYRVVVVRTSDSSVLLDTGFVTSTATSFHVTGMLTDVEYDVQVTVRNAALVSSGTGHRLITPSYGTPDQPVIVLTPNPTGGYLEVAVTNPSPSGDRPTVVTNRIFRRVVGEADFIEIGSVGNSQSYRDYAAASGVAYEYFARGES